jgi:uncharacterized Ntn-hydrolase superfamily protein
MVDFAARTYSIVARCPDTGNLGVAVQTCNFAVGSCVPWIRAGLGAVVTQAFTNISYGPKALDLLHSGVGPEETLARLVAADEKPMIRQVGVVAANAQVAAHTGQRCVRYAGHIALDGAVVLGNMLRNSETVEAMATSWRTSSGQPLHERLLAALRNAQDAGGDIRGKQSAAIKVAGPDMGEWWEHIYLDLRVDDSPDPLAELSRLLHTSLAYKDVDDAGISEEQGDRTTALALWNRARAASPDSPHFSFWHGVFLVDAGRIEEATEALAMACRHNKDFPELLQRLFEAGQLKTDPALLRSLRNLA